MDRTFVGIMGIVFIVIGVLGAIGIIVSFDWPLMSDVKNYPATYRDVADIIIAERNNTLILAGATLVANLAIGSLLLAMDKIIGLLTESNEDDKKILSNIKWELEKLNDKSS